ncbi:tetratricopeptide repeat protein [Nonomuraea sp. NPDC050310]|uniref:tetratricopeptide repeat protein n=1 Tax=Nonomuraea sp. NPDC050310 TaxID=3154935 RepID=UPI0033FA1DA6
MTHWTQAAVLRRAQRYAEAEQAARQAVARFPDAAEALVELGRIQTVTDRDEALQTFTAAARLAPADDLPVAWQVAALHLRRKPAEAVDLGVEALTRFPESWVIRVAIGRTYLAGGDYREALPYFEQAVRLAPGEPRAESWLMITLAALWRLDEAAEIAARFPDDPRMLCAWAMILHSVNRPADAVEHFDRALALNPGDPSAGVERAIALLSLDRVEDTERAAHELAERHPHAAAPLVVQAAIARRRGEDDLSVALVEQALAIEPPLPWALALRIEAAGPGDEALVARALARRPDHPSVLCAAAWYAVFLDRHDEALAHVDRILAVTPSDDEALAFRVRLLYWSGREEEAERLAARSLERLAPRPVLHLARAKVLEGLDRPEGALAELDLALAASPRYEDALTARSSLLVRLGRHEEALGVLDELLELNPRDRFAMRLRLDSLHEAGRVAEVRDFGRLAVARHPWAPELHTALAWAHAQLGELDEAVAAIRRALELAPDDCEALARERQITRMAAGEEPGELSCFC